MQKAVRDFLYCVHSPHNPPQITVKPGEEFLAETGLNTGEWLHSADDGWTPEKTNALNPTVVVAVEGAKPGDMLAVDILSVVPENMGYTGFDINANSLANKIMVHDWGINARTVKIDSEYVYWSDKVKIPIKPMIGTLGTAPKEEVLSNAKGGVHGGNMDVQEACAGNTVYLPVEVENALLHIGDVHAVQADGEINCNGGIECRSEVKLRVRLMKRPKEFRCVRIENDDYIMTVACERSLEESFYLACEQIISWMAADYGFTVKDAYLLAGQVMESRNTQFVNPTRTYICKMPKQFLV